MGDIDVSKMQIHTRMGIGPKEISEKNGADQKIVSYINKLPLEWARKAGELGGSALMVGVELWFLAGVKKSKHVPFNVSKYSKLGMSRSSLSRGLMALERAHLIQVERKPGQQCLVTVLDYEKEKSNV